MEFIKKAYVEVRAFARSLEENSVEMYSAQAAFFIIISYSPFMLIMNRPAIGLSIIPALWAASRFMTSIIGGVNKIHGCERVRSKLKTRLMSVVYLIALQLMLIAALGLLVLGDEINAALDANTAFINMRWLIGFALIVVFLTLLYKFIPAKKIPIKKCFPGAFVSAAGWIGFSWGFSLYINNFSALSEIYGNLAAIVSIMLWLYVIMYILFAGAQFNVWLTERLVKKIEKTEKNEKFSKISKKR